VPSTGQVGRAPTTAGPLKAEPGARDGLYAGDAQGSSLRYLEAFLQSQKAVLVALLGYTSPADFQEDRMLQRGVRSTCPC
jgi:hypothetical protein